MFNFTAGWRAELNIASMFQLDLKILKMSRLAFNIQGPMSMDTILALIRELYFSLLGLLGASRSQELDFFAMVSSTLIYLRMKAPVAYFNVGKPVQISTRCCQ